MIDKRIRNAAEAVADITDGSSLMIGGFGEAGSPIELIHALIDQGASDLTIISNNTGSGEVGLAALLRTRFMDAFGSAEWEAMRATPGKATAERRLAHRRG